MSNDEFLALLILYLMVAVTSRRDERNYLSRAIQLMLLPFFILTVVIYVVARMEITPLT